MYTGLSDENTSLCFSRANIVGSCPAFFYKILILIDKQNQSHYIKRGTRKMRKEKPISDFLWYHISKRFFMILQIIFYCVDETYEEKMEIDFEWSIHWTRNKTICFSHTKSPRKTILSGGGGVNILKKISSYIIY